MAIARKVVVDDSETDQIIYSNGWIDHDFPDCHDCPHGYALPLLNAHNGTWHRYVEYHSDNQLAPINLRQ